jgi:hypothetical protein
MPYPAGPGSSAWIKLQYLLWPVALQIAASAADWLSIAAVSAAMERGTFSVNSVTRAKRAVILKLRTSKARTILSGSFK